MRVSCLQENLNKGLATVGRAVGARTTLPITNNVLLATDEARLKLAATNLEIAITCWIGAKVEEEGSITVPARLVMDYIGLLPSERVDLALGPHGRNLELRCARSSTRISGMDAADFPPIPVVTDGMAVSLEPDVLRQAIVRVVFAAATEDSRPVLTGVHASFGGGMLTLAAADGFRLAVQRSPLQGKGAEELEVIIPARALQELNRLLGDQEEPVELEVDKARTRIAFRLKNVEIVSQLIQGTFPNYAQLIPSSHTTRAVVDARAFLSATRRASVFARDGSGIVRFHIEPGEGASPGRMLVSARAEEVGENQDELDAAVTGEPAKIAFNSKYLMDVLGVFSEGQVALEMTTPSSPGVIRPVGSDDSTHVIMPMFVQW